MAKVSENEYIIVNGEKMTIKAWKQMVADKQKGRRGKKRFLKLDKPKKSEKKEKEISIVAEQIEKMLKPMITLKSVQVYRNHAYRSWGTIANEILAHREISKAMASYCVNFGELNRLVHQIQEMAKGNEKAAYQFVDKLSWKLDDMKTNIKDMMKAVEDSGVCKRYKHHEAIYGEGRQLGLRTVVTKCLKTISEIEDVIGTLRNIADNGTDPFEVGTHMSAKTRARCWA
jgi:hypothetical protein